MPTNKSNLEFNSSRFEKYILYETSTYYYLVATTSDEKIYKMIKIDRGIEKPNSLSDILVYNNLTLFYW